MARIILESGGPPRSYPVGRSLIIGRHEGCGVMLDDTQSSRENTGIAFDGRAYVIRDLDSRNGTFLNEAPVTSPEILYPGDHIRIGRTVFTFELDRDDGGLAPELRVPRAAESGAHAEAGPSTTGRGPARERPNIIIQGPGAARSLFFWIVLLAIFAGGAWISRLAFLWAFERTIPK